MSTLVRFTPEDRVLDLVKLSRSDYELISSPHNTVVHGDRTLICLQSPLYDNAAEMYIRLVKGKYWAVHFPGGAHGSHEIHLETDEHRRQKDYWYRAATDAGYPASKEFRTGGETILDVAIDGPRRTSIEVQHSFIAPKLAKARTTKTYRAGRLPVWFLDSDRTPDWFHYVPALGCNPMPWTSLPPPRAATVARGLTQFTPQQCRPGAFDACPAGRRNLLINNAGRADHEIDPSTALNCTQRRHTEPRRLGSTWFALGSEQFCLKAVALLLKSCCRRNVSRFNC